MKPKLHAGRSAVVERLRSPFINGSVICSFEQGWNEDVHLEVVFGRSGCWFEVRANSNGFIFFRPTPSWLSPGRPTCSIACRKTRLID